MRKNHNPKNIKEIRQTYRAILFNNSSIYQNNSKRKYVKFLTNLEPFSSLGAKNANKYVKLATKSAKNLAFLLLKHGVRGRKTMKKRKNEKKNP